MQKMQNHCMWLRPNHQISLIKRQITESWHHRQRIRIWQTQRQTLSTRPIPSRRQVRFSYRTQVKRLSSGSHRWWDQRCSRFKEGRCGVCDGDCRDGSGEVIGGDHIVGWQFQLNCEGSDVGEEHLWLYKEVHSVPADSECCGCDGYFSGGSSH